MTKPIVTVFGGTGFIGRYLISKLARAGAIVKVATRVRQSAYFLRPCGAPGQIVPFECDVLKDDSVENVVSGSTHVVNLIGILAQKGQNSFDRIHVDVPERIAKACLQHNIKRLVHISAIGADPLASSHYARSKAKGEECVQGCFSQATVLRPSIIVGAEDDFFNRFARMTRWSPVLPLIGGGHTKFQPVYVGDVADAILSALFQSHCAGQTYELGGPHVYTFKELLIYMLENLQVRRLLLPLPWPLAFFMGWALELDYKVGFVRKPVLTVDQVRSLKVDNVVNDRAKTLKDLGISARPLESVVPSYLARFGG